MALTYLKGFMEMSVFIERTISVHKLFLAFLWYSSKGEFNFGFSHNNIKNSPKPGMFSAYLASLDGWQ